MCRIIGGGSIRLRRRRARGQGSKCVCLVPGSRTREDGWEMPALSSDAKSPPIAYRALGWLAGLGWLASASATISQLFESETGPI